jgi:hypothetical protein
LLKPPWSFGFDFQTRGTRENRRALATPGVWIPKREEPRKTGAPCVKFPILLSAWHNIPFPCVH